MVAQTIETIDVDYKLPVILAGDFNARQNSASMSLLHLETDIEHLNGRWSKNVTREMEGGLMAEGNYFFFDQIHERGME